MSDTNHKSYIKIVDGADTAVFMVHGIMSTPRHFDFLAEHIPKNVSVCNILLDGHGSTVKDFSKTSMKKWREQVKNHLSELSKTHSKIIVVGYSLGTLLTLELVKDFENIRAMILLNPPLKVFVNPVMLLRTLKFSYNKVNRKNKREFAMYNDVSIEFTPYLWQYVATIPRFLELLKLCKSTRESAKSLSIPAHVFFSESDELVSKKSAQFFANKDNVTTYSFKYCGHCYYDENFKEQAVKSLKYFLDALDDNERSL